jgi:hypothetical protein
MRASAALAAAVLVTTWNLASARADVPPEWISRVPLGTSLNGAVGGFVVDDAGVSYITGTGGPGSNVDVVTAAFAADGTLLWSQMFDGPNSWHDQGRGITLGPNGTLWVTGNTPDPQSRARLLLLQYDRAEGTLLQSVILGITDPFTSEHGASVAVDAQGNVFAVGGTTGDGGDALAVKFDAAGQLQWMQPWDGPAWGPYSQDSAWEVLLDPEGNPVVMIHGVMNSLHPDYVVIKYAASDGSVLWQANWGVNGGDFPTDMEIDAAGDVYVTGTGINFTDMFSTIKLSGEDGSLLWQEYDTFTIEDYAVALALDDAGGVYITGGGDPDGNRSNFNDNIYTVKRDAQTGSLLWQFAYGEDCHGCFDVPSDVVVDASGRCYVVGQTNSPPHSGTILFVLDAATGVETDRGVISGSVGAGAAAGQLQLDGAQNLYNGGMLWNGDTGAHEMTVVKYASLASELYHVVVPDLVAGEESLFTIHNGTPGSKQFLVYSLRGPGSTPVPRLDVTLGLDRPRFADGGHCDANGECAIAIPVPPRAAGRTAWFQVAEKGRTTPVVQRTAR